MSTYSYPQQEESPILPITQELLKSHEGRFIETTIKDVGTVTGRLVKYHDETGMADIEIIGIHDDFTSVHYTDLVGVSPLIPESTSEHRRQPTLRPTRPRISPGRRPSLRPTRPRISPARMSIIRLQTRPFPGPIQGPLPGPYAMPLPGQYSIETFNPHPAPFSALYPGAFPVVYPMPYFVPYPVMFPWPYQSSFPSPYPRP
ncbi:hypothetical protein R9X47_01280 [Wukongibacter baidiensis]|uniref:hypothetical protein n=1 Tax=Wukongibacter baidiensis TaxID=1723361 RepID=UPI003D7F720D